MKRESTVFIFIKGIYDSQRAKNIGYVNRISKKRVIMIEES